MNNPLDSLHQRFFNHFETNDLTVQNQISYTLNFIMVGTTMGLLATLPTTTDQIPGLWKFYTIVSLLLLLGIPLLYLSKSIRVTISYCLTIGAYMICNYTFQSGGIHSQIIHWLYVLPMFAALLLTLKDALFWVILSCLFYLFLFFNHQYNFVPVTFDGSILSPEKILASSIKLLIFILMMAFLFIKHSKKLLAENEHKKLDYESLIQIIAHDIANPITIIENSVFMLLKKHEGHEDLVRILKSTNTMKEIIAKMRDIRILDTGKKAIKNVPCQLSEAFAHIVFIFQERLKEKDITLTITYQNDNNKENIPLDKVNEIKDIVSADPITLRNQVLANIVSNAIKYSHPQSSILITIKKIAKSKKITIIVSDDGIGIPPLMREKIFTINKETIRPGTLGERGTGFGMILASRFAKKYGGEIHLESRTIEEGYAKIGTTVSIILNES